MDKYSVGEMKTARAGNPLEDQLAAMRWEAARAEREHLALIASLVSRVDALEASLRNLQTCTVQQFADGRLYLPAGSKLRVELPAAFGRRSYETVDVEKLTVEAPRPMTAGPPRPCGQVIITRPSAPVQRGQAPPPPSAPAGASLQSLGNKAGQGNWQSQAQSNGISNPRTRAGG